MQNLKKNLISVIIPVYNRDWTVSNTIDSVLAQTFKDFELILVDDGSTDNTLKILREYEKNNENVRVFSQKNKGVSSARNRGIMEAFGEFIAFLDSDDLWMPEKLEVQMDFFIKNPSFFVCQTDEIWVRNGKRVNPKFRHKKPYGDIFIPSLSLCLVSPSAVMMRRSFFDRAGLFDTSMVACEDYDLWLRSALIFDFGLVEEDLVVKNGGHLDQLSSLPLLDKLRIYSIDRILKSGVEDCEKRGAAIDKLVEKCSVYMGGCRKRYKWEEYFFYESLANFWRKKN